jgi:hypothetical protein
MLIYANFCVNFRVNFSKKISPHLMGKGMLNINPAFQLEK